MDHPRTSGRSQVPAILVCAAILVGVPLFLFRSQVHALWCSLSFSEAQLRGYQDLFGGEGLGEPPAGSLPERTGKVIVVRPSTHLVYNSGAVADALFWTQVHPAARNKIVREQDPPAIDGAWYSLDPSIRASGPGDVDTVVFCETRSIKVGTYGGEAAATSYAAYRFDKVLKAYDRRSERFLGSCVVLGEDPAGSTTLLGPHAGKAPSVAEVIARMPLSGG